MRVRFNFPFGFKLGIALSLLSVSITAISVYFFYATARQLILDQMQLRLQTAGRLSTSLFDQDAKASIQRLKRSSEQASLAIAPELIRTLEAGEAQPSLPPEIADRLMQSADFQRLVQILRKISESSRPELQPEQKFYQQPRFKEAHNSVSIYTYLLVTVPESPDYQLLKFICSGFYEETDNWPGNPIGNLFRSPDPTFAKVFETNTPQFGEQFFTDQWGSWLTVALPIQDEQGQIIAVVGLDYEGSSEANQLRQLRYICFSITAASMGLSILAAYFLARWLGRPISQLQAAAQRVQNRDFSTIVELKNHDELGLLAQTFNSMVTEIRSYAASLEEKNRELETRVEERTLRLGEVNAALRNSEAELRALFGAMDDVILVFDRDGCCIKVAPTRTEKFFKSPAENLGKTVHEVLPKSVADLQLDYIRRAVTTQDTQSVEYSLTLPKGEHWFDANVVPISENTVVWVARDITARKRAEAAQQEQLHLLQVILDSMPFPIFYKNAQGLYLGCNQAFLNFRGMKRDQIVGKSVYETAPAPLAEAYAAADQALFNSGGIQTYESSVAYADGSQHDVIFYKAAFLNREGELGGLVGAILDITDRKQAEAALQKSLDQLALANQEIQLLNQRLENENLRLVAELSVARQLQQMILPKEHEFKQIADLDIAGFMEPADEVGGDYYDILHHDGTVKIGIGDVTGHGLESGMLMVMVQTAVRTLLTNNETDPRHFLNTINQVIYDNAQRMNSDRNLTLALLDYRSGRVKLSGQHEEILVVRADGQIERVDTIDLGFFLGILPDIIDFITEVEVQLQPGDGIVLYTDGVTEAENGAKEYYGLERLCETVSRNWRRSADEIRQAIVEDVRSHIGQHKVYDDITLLVLKQK